MYKGLKVGPAHTGVNSIQLVEILDSSVLVEESTKHYLQEVNNFLDRIESREKYYEGRFQAYLEEKELCTKLYRIKEIIKASEKINKDERMLDTEIGEQSKIFM